MYEQIECPIVGWFLHESLPCKAEYICERMQIITPHSVMHTAQGQSECKL